MHIYDYLYPKDDEMGPVPKLSKEEQNKRDVKEILKIKSESQKKLSKK